MKTKRGQRKPSRMARALDASGLHRIDLAEALGVTVAAVDSWCYGRGLPQIRRLAAVAGRLASALRTEPNTLLLWLMEQLPEEPVPWGHAVLRVTLRDSAHEHLANAGDTSPLAVALSWIVNDAGEVKLTRGVDGRWRVEGGEDAETPGVTL